MSHRAYSASDSDADGENVYCILLHVVEGIGLTPKDGIGDFCDRHKDKIILNASLNGVKFEVEGHSAETTTIFNSNCIWECELGDLKRMKTDNRPVKVECYAKSGRSENSPRKTIGSLLLPIRGVQILSTLKDNHFKLHWHKLCGLHSEWRESKPEIFLWLIIVKKSIFESGQLEAMLGKKKFTCHSLANDALSPHVSETAMMLQSQSNVYVQLLEQLGLIQVGNNVDVDCDIFHVTLTFKQLRHVAKLVELERNYSRQLSVLIFQYDFLGSVSTLELGMNPTDSYAINEKISLSFKTSVKSLRTYFERIFYVPINLYWNGVAIANYRFDFSKYLPDDLYFDDHKSWTKNCSFHFDRLHKILSPRAPKPSVDLIFSMQLVQAFAKKHCNDLVPLNDTFVPYRCDQKGAGDMSDSFRHMDMLQHRVQQWHKSLSYYQQNMPILAPALCSHRSNTHLSELQSVKETAASGDEKFDIPPPDETLHIVDVDDQTKAETTELIEQRIIEISTAILEEQEAKNENQVSLLNTTRTVAVNTDELSKTPIDTEELTYKIVCELEEWKAQQMEHFLTQLERKETACLSELDERWQQERELLQARLEAKTAQCEELHAKLQRVNAEAELKAHVQPPQPESTNIANTVKRQIENEYAKKFQTLEAQMQRLKMELQHKGTSFEIQHKEVQIENTKLEQEKLQLRTQIEQLQKQFNALEKTHISADQLKSVLADVRIQNERFVDLEKSKQYYKDEWTKTTCELHKLKLNLIKYQKRCFTQQQAAAGEQTVDICLEDILSEEQDALNNDRTELKTIKEMLLLSSDDTSSMGELDAEQ